MPIAYVYGFERPIEKKREVVKLVTDAICKAYEVPPEIVTVYLFDVEHHNAAHGGVLESDRQAATTPPAKA